MKNQHEKMMADLLRLLDSQKFDSKDGMQKFMDGLTGKPIPSLPKKALTPKQIAQDLVFSAYEQTATKAKESVEEAILLDPDCIEAFEFLGTKERLPEIASLFYAKGTEIGRRLFCGKNLKEFKGAFWGLHETRPFMRCLQHYADCLYAMEQASECISLLEELIRLNPNDNQGARDLLMLYLVEAGEYEKFLKYSKMYPDEQSAFSAFNHALYVFKTEGATANSKTLLQEAVKQNKFVVKRLLANKPVTRLADFYGVGDENEADYYATFAQHIWVATKGAKEWLRRQSAK